MKLKALLFKIEQPEEYIDTPDGKVKICKSGRLPKTNFTIGPFNPAKASDQIPNWSRAEYYKEYITRLLPESMIKKELP